MNTHTATQPTPSASMPAGERVLAAIAAAMAVAWLVPNHYPPWTAAWSEAWCIAALLLMAGMLVTRLRLPLAALLAVALGLLGIALQLALGRQLFVGDTVISAAYLLLFLVAVAVGASGAPAAPPAAWLGGLMIGWIVAASLSVFIALVQWTQALSLGIFAADLPLNAQPFGNIGQANHLATLACLGLCALLWCHERRWIGPIGLAVAGAWLLFGMALTQSRTAGLNLVVLALVLALASRRIRLRLAWPRVLLGGLVVFMAAVWAIPRLAEGLLLPTGRPLDAQLSPGQRPAVWSGMLEALWQQPWLGYGWQQVTLAQEHFALDRPPLRHAFEHSHNLVLDLMLWNGLPIGLAAVVILAVWLWRVLKAAADGPEVCLCAALLVLCAHSMVEYPLTYAYFLVPAGLLLGTLGRHGDGALRAWRLPRWPGIAFIGLVSALALLIGWDYARIEQAYRLARFHAAGLSTPASSAVTARPWVLTQLSAPLDVATLMPKAGMPVDEIRRLRDAHRRYPSVVSGYRHALAAGLNGQAAAAALTLRRTCAMHSGAPCHRLLGAWRRAQQAHPELLAVPAPGEHKVPLPR